MPGTEYFKKNAKHTLKPRWGSAIAVVTVGLSVTILLTVLEQLVGLFFDLMPSEEALLESGGLMEFYERLFDRWQQVALYIGVSALFLLLGVIVRAPVSRGVQRYFWGVTAGGPETVGTVFDFFSSFRMYLRAVIMDLLIFLRLLLQAIILFLPCVVLIAFSPETGDYRVLVLLLGYLMGIGAAVAMIPAVLRYYMAGYILVNDNEISPTGAIKKSVKMTKGTKGSYFILLLSFIGWWLLCIFVLPVMYVLPYIEAARAHYAHFVMQQYAKKNMPADGRTQIIVY